MGSALDAAEAEAWLSVGEAVVLMPGEREGEELWQRLVEALLLPLLERCGEAEELREGVG